jgi:hypothetical protein
MECKGFMSIQLYVKTVLLLWLTCGKNPWILQMVCFIYHLVRNQTFCLYSLELIGDTSSKQWINPSIMWALLFKQSVLALSIFESYVFIKYKHMKKYITWVITTSTVATKFGVLCYHFWVFHKFFCAFFFVKWVNLRFVT